MTSRLDSFGGWDVFCETPKMTGLDDMHCMHLRMGTEREGDPVSSFGNTSNKQFWKYIQQLTGIDNIPGVFYVVHDRDGWRNLVVDRTAVV